MLHKAGFKASSIELSSVERYNSLVQLKRILTGYYDNPDIEKLLRYNILADSKRDLRLEYSGKESLFNDMFEAGVNSDLKGNCLRWAVTK